MLARTTLGLLMSVRSSQTMTASTPAASAERKMVPRFPGFSTDSATTKNGAVDLRRKSAIVERICGPSASRPSGRSLYAIFSKTAAEH